MAVFTAFNLFIVVVCVVICVVWTCCMGRGWLCLVLLVLRGSENILLDCVAPASPPTDICMPCNCDNGTPLVALLPTVRHRLTEPSSL
eukprot:12843940-Ditylum_brightwellii.AAC.1